MFIPRCYCSIRLLCIIEKCSNIILCSCSCGSLLLCTQLAIIWNSNLHAPIIDNQRINFRIIGVLNNRCRGNRCPGNRHSAAIVVLNFRKNFYFVLICVSIWTMTTTLTRMTNFFFFLPLSLSFIFFLSLFFGNCDRAITFEVFFRSNRRTCCEPKWNANQLALGKNNVTVGEHCVAVDSCYFNGY